MRSNVFVVSNNLNTPSGVQTGVIAGESETADLKAPDPHESRPLNPPRTGDQTTENTESGPVRGSKNTFIGDIITGNKKFTEEGFNADPRRYQTLAQAQIPSVLWIGCSDSRVDPERITCAPPGELFVTRNVGNIVPAHGWSLSAVVEYSICQLKVKEIVVAGHSDCGAIKALDKDLQNPYVALWINGAREAQKRVDARISKPRTPEEKKERFRQIELENVRLQIEHLMTYPSVRQAVDEGRVQVHGLYYDLKTGRLSQVV